MGIAGLHHGHVAVDCECGVMVEASDEDELLDEVLQHIAAAHEDGLRLDHAALLVDMYDA